MQSVKIFALAAAVILLFLLLWTGAFYYKTELEPTPVITEVSPNGEAELTIYQIGEPAWPFGPTDCRFVLQIAGARVIKYGFSIHDDGAPATEGNFRITWKQDHVEILVRASEQYAHTYMLYFDGNTAVCQEDFS